MGAGEVHQRRICTMRSVSRGLRHVSRRHPAQRPYSHRLVVEQLEGRLLLATTFTQTNLVSDLPGMAKTTDPNLVNPWGMALGLNSGLWVSDNGAGKATTYDGKGQPLPPGSPLVVSIPAHGGGMSLPTGVATNATAGFFISAGGKSAPSSET